MAEKSEGASSTSIHVHGNGSFHTHTPARSCDGSCGAETGRNRVDYYGPGGKRVNHDSIGAALMHIARNHSDGDHMHVHATEEGYTTHHVVEGGRVQGPKEHKTVRELKRAVSDFADEEAGGAAEDEG